MIVSAPDALNARSRLGQRCLHGIGPLGGQRGVPAGGACIEVVTGHQRFASGRHGLGPVAGGAGVGAGRGADGHGRSDENYQSNIIETYFS